MTRYEVENMDGSWFVVDRATGLAVNPISDGRRTQIEAQALADFRNGLRPPTREPVRHRLAVIRRTWKLIVGTSR
jgi:hypothetical protein